MTVYATAEELKRVLAPTGSEARTPAEMSIPVLEQAIRQAQGDVDGYCAGRYKTPFTAPVPGLVWSLTLNISQYYATLTHRRGADLEDTDPSLIRFRGAMQQLKDIGLGLITLEAVTVDPTTGAESSTGDSVGGEAWGVNTQDPNVFSPQDWTGLGSAPPLDLPEGRYIVDGR